MIRNILCPVDGSDCARSALQVALALAEWRDAHLTVINVGPAVLLYPALVARVSPAVVATPTRAERAADLARFLQPYANLHRPIDVVLTEGDAAATIAAAVGPHAIDLIVMGTHGRSGLGRLAFGSVTAHVVRIASCPVLIVPPGAQLGPSFHGFTRVIRSASAPGREYAPLLTAGDRARVTTLPSTKSSDAVLRSASDDQPDLIVWDRARPGIDVLARKTSVPVLSVGGTQATQTREVHAAAR